jgi:cytoskeletal protein RodZ
LTWLLIAAAAILVIVAVYILTNRQPAEIPGSATEVAQATQQSVDGMTETVEATPAAAADDPTPEPAVEETPTEAEATPAPAVDETPAASGDATSAIEGLENEPADAFYSALSGLGVVEGSGQVVNTSKGRTLTFDVCTAPSVTRLREAALEALTTMAGMSGTVQDSVDAVGVRLVNCDAANAVLRYVVVDLASAVDFSSGALSQTSFAAAWDAEASQ